jgi:predicted DNA-binding transcriptional regulator AlpA
MKESPYINGEQVARLLRITTRTLHTYVKQRKVPSPIWLGGKRLWFEQALHDYIAAPANRKRG